jgi:hypothetical protein
MSSRNVNATRARGDELRCSRCRGARATPPARLDYREYWLDRFTLEEIRELAAGIWPKQAA